MIYKLNTAIVNISFYFIVNALSFFIPVVLPSSISCLNLSCKCPFYFEPKCASNGITYPNQCYVECYNAKGCSPRIQVIREGRCENFSVEWRPNAPTTTTELPKTTKYYSNKCNETACNCRYGYNPICASDQVTYSNTCFFRCARGCNHELVFVKCGLCEWTYPPHRRCLGKTIL